MNSNQIMTRTGMALIPGFLASVWVFGLGILLNVAAALLAALVLEMAYHQVRRRPQTQASLSSGLFYSHCVYRRCSPLDWLSSGSPLH